MKARSFDFLMASVFVLLTSFSSFAITVKVNAIPNDDLDDSAAIQKAFTEVLTGGGGTVIFPPGTLDLKAGVTLVPDTYKPVNVILRGDGGSIIRISVGGKGIAIRTGNLNRLQIDNMVFMGKNVKIDHPDFIDAHHVILASWISLIRISNTSFLGIAVSESIVHASSNLTIDNCQFDGNSASYPGAVVNLDCCMLAGINANISNTTFVDYTHFNGEYLSKSESLTGSWVRVQQKYWDGPTENQRLSIEDSFFDEGAAFGVNVENIGSLSLRGLRFNVSGTGIGTGVWAENVRRVRIEDSLFGWSQSARPLAILKNSTAEMVGVSRANQVKCPDVDSSSKVTWRLSDCK